MWILLVGSVLASPERYDEHVGAWAERHAERLDDVHRATKRFVRLREGEERRALSQGFDALIGTLEGVERSRRELAIERFEAFLGKYDGTQQSASVRYRLAELRYEEARDVWLQQTAAWFAAMESDPDGDHGEPPQLQLDVPTAHYRTIVADHADYEQRGAAWYMVAYAHLDPTSSLYDEAAGKQVLAEFLAALPDDPLAGTAHLYLGSFAFDTGDLGAAIYHFQQIGPGSPHSEEATYRLAWSHYRASDYDNALPAFAALLDASDPAFGPDARRFLAHSLIDRNDDAVAGAHTFFADRRPAWERDAWNTLAHVLTRYGRFDEAFEAMAVLQDDPRWADHRDNPSLQAQVIAWKRQLGLPTGPAATELVERYGAGSAWWQANQRDPDARNTARALVEDVLADVARQWRIVAEDSGDPADFAAAASKYRTWLETFPVADDWYANQWIYADSLLQSGDAVTAAAEYRSLVRSARFHEHGVDAHYKLVEALLAGPRDAELITAVDAVLALEPDSDVRRALVPKLLYVSGQTVLDLEGDPTERLERVIREFPTTEEAAWSATLLVDHALKRGDLARVASLARRFSTLPLGPEGRADPRLVDALHKALFQQAQQTDGVEAAAQFQALHDEFPASPYAADALYNAGYHYADAGRAIEALAALEQLLHRFPADARVAQVRWDVAQTHESLLQLDDARDAYTALYKRHPDDPNAANAVYNAAIVHLALDEPADAARAFERYGRLDQPDSRDVRMQAAGAWERVGDPAARRFYKRVLADADDVQHHVVARCGLARIDGRWSDVLEEERPATLDPQTRDCLGEAAYRVAEDAFAQLRDDTRFTDDFERDLQVLLDTEDALAELGRLADRVGEFESFEWNTAAVALQGRSALWYADFAFGIGPGKVRDPDVREGIELVILEELHPRFESFEDAGVERLAGLVDDAAAAKRHSPWIDAALRALNEVEPGDWPLPHPEKRGDVPMQDATVRNTR